VHRDLRSRALRESRAPAKAVSRRWDTEELHAHLNDLTERVIREAINEDVSEAAEQPPPKALPQASSG
jgi:hypothetical protein